MLLFYPKIATNDLTFHSGPVWMAREIRGSYKNDLGQNADQNSDQNSGLFSDVQKSVPKRSQAYSEHVLKCPKMFRKMPEQIPEIQI